MRLSLDKTLVVVAALPFTTSCTLLEPIQPPATSFRMPTTSRAGPAASAAAGAAASAPIDGRRQRCVELTACAAGGVTDAIRAVQDRQFAYEQLAADSANTNARYNTLIWPGAGAVLHEPLRSASRPILPGIAVLAGTYGMLKSGIPDRATQYQETATRLHRAIAVATARAYFEDAIEGTGDDKPPEALASTVYTLRVQLPKVVEERALLKLPLHPPAPPTAADSLSRQGRVSSNTAPNPREIFDRNADRLLAHATTVRGELEILLEQVRGQGAELLSAAQCIVLTDQAELIGKVPGPKPPTEVLSELRKLKDDVATLRAQGEARQQTEAVYDLEALGPLLPEGSARDRLANPGRADLDKFEKVHVNPLRTALVNAREWLARDKVKRARAATLQGDAKSCIEAASATPPPAPSPSPSPAPANAAGRPTTPATNESAGAGQRALPTR